MIYDQLLNLQKRFKNVSKLFFDTNIIPSSDDDNNSLNENVSFKYIKPYYFKHGKIFRHIFLLKFSDSLIKTVATILGINMFNTKLGFNMEYNVRD